MVNNWYSILQLWPLDSFRDRTKYIKQEPGNTVPSNINILEVLTKNRLIRSLNLFASVDIQ